MDQAVGRDAGDRPAVDEAGAAGAGIGAGELHAAVPGVRRAGRLSGRPLQQAERDGRFQGGRNRRRLAGRGRHSDRQRVSDVRHAVHSRHPGGDVHHLEAGRHPRDRPLGGDFGGQRADQHGLDVGHHPRQRGRRLAIRPDRSRPGRSAGGFMPPRWWAWRRAALSPACSSDRCRPPIPPGPSLGIPSGKPSATSPRWGRSGRCSSWPRGAPTSGRWGRCRKSTSTSSPRSTCAWASSTSARCWRR